MEFNKVGNIIYPEGFISNYIYCHSGLNSDLEEIIDKSGEKAQFGRKFRKALKFLEALKKGCTNQSQIFEKLKREEYFYSMKIKDKHNVRIIFSFFEYGGKEIVILLYAFPEKSPAKQKNPKSYSYAIEKAKERLEELKSTYPDLKVVTT
ncbi:hypothetical protein ELD05_11920 [Caldicellulosiruptor changbaiensis]|uniref:Type II toxin-antitoxin system RelE/ParE family toxin n=1 Tax=Caldicellulosiruptor changbaiensis TaxID=1222016 RepID=A0A3T0D809_9FIRM|nr:hypothetical protein [Caldicellulosiruptor changbaiensis]AZT91267.1 hypothetical protein ELD05_11920 [Caldicellulosiruptor changbaiensis]